ncbi:MAG: TonB-dependent receptor [Acidobacteria bacterium]|nr:TonB-dependent receptor [Acidobacteriota bacterium]
MQRRIAIILILLALACASAFAQETRATIFGRVLDPQGSAIPSANVVVKNTDTNVTLTFKTNETGYYEASLLLPGNYQVDCDAAGFKHLTHKGVILPVSTRLEVNLAMEVGGVTEVISVTGETQLLETSSVTSGRVVDNKSLMELPVMGNSAIVLVRWTPGVQWGGVNLYLAPHSNIGGSDYNIDGNVGGNSWTLDGSPNQGPSRRLAYLPYTDGIAEYKIETNNFDAGIGQSTGVAISMVTKSGTNALHGTMTWQHWQQRWQGTPFFVKQNYFRSIAAAEAAGDTARANRIRGTDKQQPGRSNNWGISAQGPVYIPKIFDGRNRLFWAFTYNGLKDVKSEEPVTYNRTVPTANARNGDFREMLALPNPGQYVVYDPATVVPDPARPTHYIRTPFADNVIPKSRFVNPAYDAIAKLYPLPNNPPAPGQQPVNNFLSFMAPYNWDYYAVSNRVDYQISDRFRIYGRWSANNFGPENRGDWTIQTAPGLNIGGLVRNNKGGNVDLVFTQSPATLWDFNVAINQFREGGVQPYALSLKPSDIGLPKYLDDKAGAEHILPLMNVNGYTQISPGGRSNWTRYRMATAKIAITHIRGNHTIQSAFDNRYHFRTALPQGNTSGNFNFNRSFTRKDDDGFVPSVDLGLGWAAFILGVPNSMTIQTLDSYATMSPYYGAFVQDSWRFSRRLTLNLGLRMEYERGATERYNRMIGGFDPTLTLPITSAAQAAYGASPLRELAASEFKVLGGTVFPGVGGTSRELYKSQAMWMPRAGVAYQWNNKTVLRAGYGIYYDTLNVLNFGPDQSGYTQNTSTVMANDPAGYVWNPLFGANSPASQKTPLADPFPVRADGTRFDAPTRDLLGAMAKAGRGFGFTNSSQEHARQQRWRAGMQRQLGRSWLIDAAYAGSYSDRVSVARKLDALPQQFWADGKVRNDAIATDLNSNVASPFRLANFAGLQQSQPVIYKDMTTLGMYTSSTIRKANLLRPFPHMNGNLTNNVVPDGKVKSHSVELHVQKRFSHGFNLNFGYTALKVRERNFYFNEFDAEPSWRTSNSGRPQRIVGTGIFEFPFGRGRRYASQAGRALDTLIGGWQTGVTYEYQPGALLDWGNPFYYGNDLADIVKSDKTFDQWFNTANFERASAKQPAAFHRRVFPVRVPDVRADKTSQWNLNMSKNVRVTERVNLQLRLDALNIQNRSQMGGPNTDPTSTNFGRITSQSQGTNRWLDVQARLTF